MERTSILIATLALFSASVSAQDKKEHHHRNYLRAGYHISDLVGENDLDTRSGFYAGYHHTIVKAPLIGVSLGIEYNTAGAQKDAFERKMGYLGIPANARLKLGPAYLDAGLGASYLLSDEALLNGTEWDQAKEAEDFDVLAHVGGGIKVLMLAVEVRYRHALTEVYSGYRNTGLQIGLALHL